MNPLLEASDMKFISGTVVGKKIWADGLFTLQIDAPGVEPFEPGQYLQLGVQRPEKHLHRPYSVASPYGKVLEFFIVRVDDGRLTPTLWSMTIGDAIDVSTKGIGSFTITHLKDREDLWLVGTGTGLAPYIAMLRTEETWQRFNHIRVVHGVRYLRDLAYQDEMAAYEAKYGDRFKWLPVVSREQAGSTLQGRITQVLSTGLLESSANLTIVPSKSVVMLCGNPDMLNEMEDMLIARGMKRHSHKEPGDIVVERYW